MKALMAFIFGGSRNEPFGAEFGLFIARVTAGLSMAIAHGWGKVQDPSGVIKGASSMGFPMPELFGWAAALSEFGAAILVAIGLATRPAALLVCATMAVAAFMRHGADPFKDKELAIIYLVMFLIFAFKGAGRLSIDALIRKRT